MTVSDDFIGCIGIKDGKIAEIGSDLPAGDNDIDATGKLVMPGGIDSHCHVAQISSMNAIWADEWCSASVLAAMGTHGGQCPGQSIQVAWSATLLSGRDK